MIAEPHTHLYLLTVEHLENLVFLCDVIAPPFGIIHHGNTEIIMESENIVVDGFGRCFNVLCQKEVLDAVAIIEGSLRAALVESVPLSLHARSNPVSNAITVTQNL